MPVEGSDWPEPWQRLLQQADGPLQLLQQRALELKLAQARIDALRAEVLRSDDTASLRADALLPRGGVCGISERGELIIGATQASSAMHTAQSKGK